MATKTRYPTRPTPVTNQWLWWHLTLMHEKDLPLTSKGMVLLHATLHRSGTNHSHRGFGRPVGSARMGTRQLSLLRTIEANPGQSKAAVLRIDDAGHSKPRSLMGRQGVIDRLIEDGLVYNNSIVPRRFTLYLTDEGHKVLRRERALG